MATEIPSITTLSEPAHRGTDVRGEFVIKQEAFQDDLHDVFVDEMNAAITATNTVAGEVEADAAATAADVVLTNADVVLTNADVVLTNADVVTTGEDVVLCEAAVSTLPEGTINDLLTTLTNAWSAQKIIDTISGNLGYLTKTFSSSEEATIQLSESVDVANVAVTKEVTQLGLTNNDWDVDATGSNYDVEDFALATTLTPNTVDATLLTLGSGSFSASHVGMKITGNGGEAILIATDGSCVTTVDFADTSAIASGNWSMQGLDFSVDGIEVTKETVVTYKTSLATFVDDSISATTNIAVVRGYYMRDDGLKLYTANGGFVYMHDLSTAYDITTIGVADSINIGTLVSDAQLYGLSLSNDGTKMFVAGDASDKFYELDLGTAWDTDTASYSNIFKSYNTTSSCRGMGMTKDGLHLFAANQTSGQIDQYTLGTAWDMSSASYTGNFDGGTNTANLEGLTISIDGKYVLAPKQADDSIKMFTMSTPFDITTMSFTDSLDITSKLGTGTYPVAITYFKNDSKILFGLEDGSAIHQYTSATIANYVPINQQLTAITNASGQINTTYWADINSITTTEELNNQTINYAMSADDRTTWEIAKTGESPRSIVRDNAGTWEYNSNATYGSTTWTSSAINTEFQALSEAMTISVNQMSGTQADAVGDAEWVTLGNELDFCAILYSDDVTEIPISDGFSINYDANVLNQGAIEGTDYTYDHPAGDVVRIQALAANNLKVRIS